MLLTNKEFRFFSLMMVLFLLLPALLTLSDAALDLNQTNKQMIRGNEGNRLSNAMLPSQRRDLVILAQPLHGDQVQFKSLKRELLHAGYTTFTFDFPGHGRSFGTAFTGDEGSRQRAKDLIEVERQLLASGKFTTDDLYYVGFGAGASAMIEAAIRGGIHPKQMILVTRGQHREKNSQASMTLLQENLPGVPIQWLYGSPHSPTTIQSILDTLEQNRSIRGDSIPSLYPALRLAAIILGFLGLILVPVLILFYKKTPHQPMPQSRKQIMFHISSWIGALLLALPLLYLISLIPAGKPLLILLYPLTIGSYGLIKILTYIFSPAGRGFRPIINRLSAYKVGPVNRQIRLEALRTGGSIAAFWMIVLIILFRLGLYYVIPFNAKQIWFWLLTVVVFPGFYAASLEQLNYGSDRKSSNLLAIIRWFPFFTLPLSKLLSGSEFGLTDSPLHLTILLVVLVMGRLMLKVKVSPIQTAFSQALIYSLILVPQSAMLGA